MINKDKINRALVYNKAGRMLLASNSVTFPKDFFKIKGQELVMLKGKNFPEIDKEEPIEVIFEYVNGNRVKYDTHIDICTDYQINFHVGKGELLKERRRSFKITVDMNGISPFFIRGEEMFAFDDPIELHFVNINLGGVFFSSNSKFEPGDQVMLNFLDGEMQLLAEILRVQRKENGELEGYGCCFISLNKAQEERLARFIFDCQVLERERRLAEEEKKNKMH